MYYCSKCGTQSEFEKCLICGSECVENDFSGGNIKGRILDNLYTLRAGISEISRKHDQVELIIKEKKENNKIKNEKKAKLKTLKKKYQNSKTVVENYSDEKNNEAISRAKITIHNIEREKSALLKRNSLLRYFLLFVVLIGVITISFRSICPEPLMWLWWSLVAVELLLFVVLSTKNISNGDLEKIQREKDELINEENKKISVLTKKTIDYTRCKDKLSSFPSIVEDAEREILNLKADSYYDEQINNLVNEGKYIFQTLIEHFNGFLNVQDWKYLDVIIYMFETSRALSIQDALRQTDELVRHGELISVMKEIGTRICNTIQHSTSQISFRLDMLENSQRILYSGVEELGGKVQGVKNSIISASNMQAALLEKANTNSERIMEDVHQLRKYADDLVN